MNGSTAPNLEVMSSINESIHAAIPLSGAIWRISITASRTMRMSAMITARMVRNLLPDSTSSYSTSTFFFLAFFSAALSSETSTGVFAAAIAALQPSA